MGLFYEVEFTIYDERLSNVTSCGRARAKPGMRSCGSYGVSAGLSPPPLRGDGRVGGLLDLQLHNHAGSPDHGRTRADGGTLSVEGRGPRLAGERIRGVQSCTKTASR